MEPQRGPGAGSGSPCRGAKHSPGALNLDTFYHAAQAALGAPYNFIVSSCNNTGKRNNNVKLALIKMKGVCLSLLLVLSQGSLLSCAEQSEECFRSRRQPPPAPLEARQHWSSPPLPQPPAHSLLIRSTWQKGMKRETWSGDFFLRVSERRTKCYQAVWGGERAPVPETLPT